MEAYRGTCEKDEAMTIWFTSDTHFYHGNIIRFCDRPFRYADEMTEQLIKNWNAVVQPNDQVYHLGDFAFASKGRVVELLCRLNGEKRIIAGNHDRSLIKRDDDRNIIVREIIQPHVIWIKDCHELTIQDKSAKQGKTMITLNHYAQRVWNKSHWGAWHLYGHSHGSLPEEPTSLSIDVGVDAVAKRYAMNGIVNVEDYRPICYEEIKVIMESKEFKPIDHHGDKDDD